ncbi:MAG: acetyltransferase [Caulobacterales bacterium]|nr:acetyltransferase [Caulobacterales bacterium]
MKPVVIFGTGKIAEVVHSYFAHESDREVAAFTVDREHMDAAECEGRPVVPFEELSAAFPPGDVDLFIALGYQQMNRLRAERVARARDAGYGLATYVHPRTHIPKGVVIGANCFIMSDALIQPKATLGDNVFVWSGALVGHHVTIGDDCWITSTAAICGQVTVGKGCFFAAHATVGNGVAIGDRCFLGANALVTKNLEEGGVVVQPASQKLQVTSDQFIRMSTFR